MEKRYFTIQNIETRSDENNDNLYLEGSFARYDDIYEVWEGVTESIQKGAFKNSIKGDVRALYNHNTDIVLGRTTAGTFELLDRDNDLWGRITLNRKDSDAVNVYERVSRGDVTGCSIGFEIKSQKRFVTEDGGVHYTITEIEPLYECTITPFPAYEATHIEARAKDEENIKKRMLDEWKIQMRNRLKGVEENGVESIDDQEEA